MGTIKVYNGSNWVETPNFKTIKVYDGSNWVPAKPKVQTNIGWNRVSSDTKVITTGYYFFNTGDPFVPEVTTYSGFFRVPFTDGGTINDTFTRLYDDAIIYELFYYSYSTPGFIDEYIRLGIIGATNDGWTTMNINGYNFNRSSATFSGGTWQWDNPGVDPFNSGAGNIITVTWS